MVVSQEAARAFRGHKPFQYPALGFGEVHNNQAIQNVAEMAIDVEAHDSAAQLQIVLQENWYLFAVSLDLGDQL